MKLGVILLLLCTVFVVACGPEISDIATEEIDCAVDLPASALDTAFAGLVTQSFVLVDSSETDCQYSAGVSPNSEVTIGVSVAGISRTEADAQESFEGYRSATTPMAANPNWAPEVDGRSWDSSLGFASGWYGVKTPADVSTVNFHGVTVSGQEITIGATHYAGADLPVLATSVENVAALAHSVIA